MRDTGKSCLVEKLSAFIELGEVDAGLLADLEKDTQTIARNTLVWSVKDEIKNLYVVRKGWLITYAILQDGRRQLLELHYPGDVIGASDIPFEHATSNLMAIESCELCPFPKRSMDVIFRQSPTLTALLYTLAMIDKSVILDRLSVLGRMSARERIAHLLLEIHSRLQITKGVVNNRFRLPLSQFDIGDAVGLTNVSVSNGLAKLEDDGLIRRDRGHITLLDCEKLTQLSDFINRYSEVDVSWFPRAH
ncbi:Crp/Fnr family transcriptional regulator [Arenicella xantha]|uniref:CRP-like cAMP-binding protein n=1 Tax=Arenicella xantha TaxID=644221 RepID=A0A395JIV5_9GAMM|nr:Crp/Fnr family transcriptional regulator [Arenicella xantha]RBP48708.1 CRP-like cAMP-binding protein [Arenicella xantha]